jgi:hypothetical protein
MTEVVMRYQGYKEVDLHCEKLRKPKWRCIPMYGTHQCMSDYVQFIGTNEPLCQAICSLDDEIFPQTGQIEEVFTRKSIKLIPQ